MKAVSKSLLIATVATLGLGLAACKKDAAEEQADDVRAAAEATADAMEASGAPDAKADAVRASGEAKADRIEDKAKK